MHKRILHHYQTRLRPVSSWYFLIVAVFFLSIAAFSLRQNNVTMLRLRETVFQADEAGDDVESPLRDLRDYVHSHMNTDLATGDTAIRPPIQLKYTYERLVEQEQESARLQNESIYETAERVCEERFPAGRLANGRVQCVEQYVSERGAEADAVPRELYQFDFVSPRWSPDLAGWSLLAGVVFSILFVVRLMLEFWLRHSLRT
ncbi:hypothetical protein BH23PAT2_BH23PAT2_04720 [soil metagenome]